MQFPESWLREFCDPPIDTTELAERLTMAGLEVESMRPVAPPFHGVVVAEVIDVKPHPGADRLRLCQVDAGDDAPLEIVCGAPNVRAGMKVPLARVGAELPPKEEGGPVFRIEVGRIRGVESRGMLCSSRELGLSDDHGGLLVLDDAAPVGANLRDQLALDDTVFTLKLTPNLGHCLSVYGVARELSALTGAPLKAPPSTSVAVDGDELLRVRIDAPDLCGRFSGRVISNVDLSAKTPTWMADRLARCGQRTVAPLVDISNYVMFESGQPSHIFDRDVIEGGLDVRWGHPGESLELLNGNTVELDAEVGVIADAAGVESLAGIMGGQRTAVSEATRNVYVEAAFWWPESVAGRSRRYRFATDAGHRFERGVDPGATVQRLERISALIVEICGGPQTRCGPIDDQVVAVPQLAPVKLRVARAAKVIGLPLTQADCEQVMTRLGFEWTSASGEVEVKPPSWRFDINLEEDLIEEVIRLLGYDTLDAAPPVGRLEAKVGSESRRSASRLRHHMADLGWHETIGFSFVDARWERDFAGNEDPVRVINPIAQNQSVMRSSLIGSLVDVLRVNLSRKTSRLRVFELGKVYLRDATAVAGAHAVAGVRQPLRLGGLAFGSCAPLQWGVTDRPVDFYDVKGDLEALSGSAGWRFVPAAHPALHPGRSAAIERGGVRIGVVGELHPRWRQSYELPGNAVVFEIDAEALMQVAVPALVPLPKLQPAWRDIAIVVRRSVSHEALLAAVEAGGTGVVRATTLFDVYDPKTPVPGIGADEHSVALRVEMRDDTHTFTDQRIDEVMAGIVASLSHRLGARLRAAQ